MSIYDADKDYYYIDMFNLIPEGPTDKMPRQALEGTVRLYTTKGQGQAVQLDKCIFVAPYIEPVSYSGTNMWTNGDGSVMDIAIKTATDMAKWWNDQMQDLKADSANLDILKSILPDGAVDALINGVNKATGNMTSNISDYQVYNLGQFKKAFAGTQVTHPMTSISATYFSDPSSLAWFASDASMETQPLRRLCSNLLVRLLGTMTPLYDNSVAQGGTGDKKAAIQFAPNNIQGRQMTSIDGAVPNAFALVIGCGKNADASNHATIVNSVTDPATRETKETTYTSIINQPRILWNVLPTQLVISPSRLLTPSNDYYYVKIDIGFEMASYLDVTTLASDWIGEDIYEKTKADLKKSGGTVPGEGTAL